MLFYNDSRLRKHHTRKQPMAVQMLKTHMTVISLLHTGWLQPSTHQLNLQHVHLTTQIAVLPGLFLQSVYSFASACKSWSYIMTWST